jgi:hypothetical protein
MKTRRFRTKVISIVGLVAVAVGIMLATPTAAPASVGGFFEIVNPVYGSCVDVPDGTTRPGATLQSVACENNNNQLFAPEVQSDNVHLVWHNRASGLCLHATGAFTTARVDQQLCNPADAGQRWFWRGADPVGHLVLNSDLPNMCLSLHDAPPSHGTPIMVANCATVVAQFFRIDN